MGCGLSDEDVGFAIELASSTGLSWSSVRRLDVHDNRICPTGVRMIAERMPLLEELFASSNRLGSEGARIIAEHLPHLRLLYLYSE